MIPEVTVFFKWHSEGGIPKMEETSYNWLLDTMRDISAQTALLISDSNDFDQNGTQDMDTSFQTEFSALNELCTGQKPEQILKTVFGFDSFRPLQREIIQNVLDGRDTLAVIPTGGGKSLCYEIPALIMDGLTVVVSPLIALMQDQVAQLEAYGVEAVFLNSTLDWDTYRDTADKLREGKIKLLYVSPEGLNTDKMRDILHSEKVDVKCITIDEAHCVSEWGHDFRPDYLEIASVREQFPKAVCLALTATATKQVRADIVKQLKLENPAVLVASFNRPNIFLEVKRKADPLMQLISFLQNHKGQSGIIYCFSRKQVDMLTQTLSQEFSVTSYHAGLTDEERTAHQEDFIRDKVSIIVATVAFGMGINKPDVRFVIHYDLPKSIEQYYQEIGRAGPDGLAAHALLLFSPADIHKIRYFFDESADASKAERLLAAMVSYAESRTCRRKQLLAYFGESYTPTSEEKEEDTCCDICSYGSSDAKDMTTPAQKYMSCILRTEERFGASYIIDVLLGSRQKRILENEHDKLSTFGIGRDIEKNDWFELNSCLIEAEYIVKSSDYGVLSLSQKGHDALRNREKIFLPVQFTGTTSATKKCKGRARTKNGESAYNDDTSYAEGISATGTFVRPAKSHSQKAAAYDTSDKEAVRIADRLRVWRRHLADELNQPPYVIFGDKTLADIASRKPQTQSELLICYGIGEMKAEKFGAAVLRIVRNEE